MSMMLLAVCTIAVISCVAGASFKERDLLTAAVMNDLTTLDAIIAEGELDLVMKYKDETPLHIAASSGHVEVAARLLDSGVPIETKDYMGFRAITMATLSGHVEMVRLLAARGSNINTMDDVDDKKYMLLEKAASLNHMEVLKLLLELGMDINARTDDDNTALMVL